MSKNKRKSIRFDERTMLILNELAGKRNVNISVIVRALVTRGLDELIDKEGNIKSYESSI